jgi:hypothetical protein
MPTRIDLNFLEPLDVEAGYKPQFVLVENQSFEGKKIPVDNHQYVGCDFRDCAFLYSGGPFRFWECSLEGEGTFLNLIGAAHRSVGILRIFQEHAKSIKGPY